MTLEKRFNRDIQSKAQQFHEDPEELRLMAQRAIGNLETGCLHPNKVTA